MEKTPIPQASGFKKAERKQVKIKIAVTGPSGSGKTYSSLRLAKGLGTKIAVVDTENGSASLYSDKFGFDVLEISAPYTVEKYVAAIEDAVRAGYEVAVIDSLSHVWAGEGGLLEQKEAMDSRGCNSFANWGKITKSHEALKSRILQSDIHVVATMRSKQEYAQEKDDKTGRLTIKKLGLAPIQRDGMEYDFSVVFDVGMDHKAQSSKDRTGLFSSSHDQRIFTITEETGADIKKWLHSGIDPTLRQQAVELATKYSIDPKAVSEVIKSNFGKERLAELDNKECKVLIEWMINQATVTTQPST